MYEDYKPSTAEWIDLLSIAYTYGLERVYRHVIAQIEDIDVTDDPINRALGQEAQHQEVYCPCLCRAVHAKRPYQCI